jgi:glycosyltransferase involved in cell wall biosynthesis
VSKKRPDRSDRRALSIVTSSGNLRSIYALRSDLRGNRAKPEARNAAEFLLWAATTGRKEVFGVEIDIPFFTYLTESTDGYLSRLGMFAATLLEQETNKTFSNIDDFHFWYYAFGVPELNLEMFVTKRELQELEARLLPPGPDGGRLSLLDTIVQAAAGDAATAYDLRNKEHRRSFKSPEVYREMVRFAPWLQKPLYDNSTALPGVNLIGYAQGVLGIGEDIRALASVLRHSGIPYAICDVPLSDEHATSQESLLSGYFVDRPIFPVNIFCMPAFETERVRLELGANLFAARYNVGYWPWELSTIPDYWLQAFDSINEVWAISPYLVDVFSACTSKPVFYMPPAVNADAVANVDLRRFGFEGNGFVFLAMLDFNSFTARKNPVGTVQAFRQAFPEMSGAERLLIKTINGHANPDELDMLVALVEADPRIVVVDGPLSRAENCGLIAAADCYVSLHRAEGFGRIIAESMLLGTPVVATDWSGSSSVLDKSTGFPVAFTLVDVPEGDYIYEEGSRWAEPDIDDAARLLRLVRKRRSLVESKLSNAKKRIIENHGVEAVAKQVIDRIAAIARKI